MNDRDVARRAAKGAAGAVGRRAAQKAAASLFSSWAGPITIIVALALVLAGCTGLMLLAGGGASSPPPGCERSWTAPAANDRILATIRTVESGGRYEVRITTSTASGAYAFIDSAWRHYAASVGVDVATYPSAWMAPHDAQDATANAYVNEILARNNNDVTTVPIAWYLPSALRNPALMDIVPAGGNRLTPRQYQQRWLTEYARQATLTVDPATTPTTATTPVMALHAPNLDHTSCPDDLTAASYTAPAGVTSLQACSISWGGYQPGRIPTTAMRYSPHSGYMHPAASAAWDQLWNAANAAGLNLNGYSYRPANQSSGASCSNHNWGLAIDVSAMVGPRFDTPEYQWLAANAATYGYANPDFARPVSLGGTGRGGWAGGTCCHLEPWHWEFVAFVDLPLS